MTPRPAVSPALACFLAFAGCTNAPPAGYPGYVEGEYVRVASPLSGTLPQLAVERGTQVTKDAPLFTLESEQERAARAEAEARVRQAQATLANLEKARRPQEIAAVRAQLAQAQASLRQSEADLARTEKLVADKFLPPQQRDQALAARDRDRGRVAELNQQVQIANLPARSDEIAAATAEVKAATDALAQAQWRVEQKSQTAPAAGLVVDTLYRPANGSPPVRRWFRCLPPANVKLRFYIPETLVGDDAHRRRGDRTLRRLRRRHPGESAIHRAAGRVHAAGDLQPGEPGEPRVPRRGAAGCAERRRFIPGCRSKWRWPPARGDVRRHGASAPAAGNELPTRRDTAIDVHGLTKRYNGRAVVDDFSIRVERGTIFGFLGPNGSGKTTTIRMLCGLLTPDEGEGTCLGYDLRREARGDQARSRLHDAALQHVRGSVDRGEPRFRRADVRCAGSRAGDRRDAGPPRPDGAARRNSPARCRADGSSGWRSPPACCIRRNCCCSTSRRRASIRRRAATSGRRSTSSPPKASPCWSARTTWTKRSAATASRTSASGSCSSKARRAK